MKKSVLVIAGFLAMAVAGSAQAATMFAVQNAAGTQDLATIDDAGVIQGSRIGAGLQNVPGSVALTAPDGGLRIGTVGNVGTTASATFQHTAYPTAFGGATYAAGNAANFALYRVNRDDSTLAYSLPKVGNQLGAFNFGTIDISLDPTTTAYRKNLAIFAVRAESTWPSLTNTPVYFSWDTTSYDAVALNNVRNEKMRLNSLGYLGIGLPSAAPNPTSRLQVVGLPEYADNATAKAALLTDGAFYRTGDVLKVVHP